MMQTGYGPLQTAPQDPNNKGRATAQSARFFAGLSEESLRTSAFEKPGQILLVEDDPLLRNSVKQFLERRLHTIIEAENAETAMALARKEPPDLILLDLGLPDADGCDICKAVKADPILQYIPIIITTGMRDAATQLRAFECGANDFLHKPLDFFLLEARVRAMLKYQRAVEALRRAHAELERRVKERTEELVKANTILRHEIEERKTAQEALRRQQQEQQTIFDSVPAMIWYKDCNNRILRVNKAGAEVIGRTAAELEGRRTEEIYPDDAAKYYADDLEVIRTGTPKMGIIEQHLSKTGEKLWVRADKLPYIDETGKISGVIALAIDVTDRLRMEDAMRENNARMVKLIENMDAMLVHDREGRFIIANRPACEQLGYTREELLERSVKDIVPDFTEEKFQDLWKRSMEAGHSVEIQGLHRRKDGSTFSADMRIGLIELGGKTLMMCLARDITARVKAEVALRNSEERYAVAARGANDGLWDWNLRDGRIYFSPRWKAMIGFKDNEIGDKPDLWFTRVHPDDAVRVRLDLDSHIEGHKDLFESEYRIRHKDGSYRWMLCRGLALRDEHEVPYRIAGSQTDITGRKIAEIRLQHDALHDGLTGLPNRALFNDRAGQAIARAQRHDKYRFAVLLMGIDRFKIINDSLGHRVGDQLLNEISRRLESVLRTGDTVARLSSDEFGILLDDIGSEEDAVTEAERMKEEIGRQFQLGDHEIFITTSIGIAIGDGRYRQPDDVLRDADTAMHRAKKRGKARHEVFRSGFHESVASVLQLETDLRNAMTRRELRLHYQPIVDLRSGKLSGFEALIRWYKADNTVVSPGDFIPLAEETDLIVPMTWWVLGEASRQLKEWQSKYPQLAHCTVNVNLSSKLFLHENMFSQIRQVIDDSGIDPAMLKFEITESAFLDQSERALNGLKELKSLKSHIVLDDFGTGYSSLSYLHTLPIDTLKIDRSFVGRMEQGKNEIVRTIINLAHNLKMDVVAEGVETAEQARQLKELHCQYGQGYLFARPLNAESAANLVAVKENWLT